MTTILKIFFTNPTCYISLKLQYYYYKLILPVAGKLTALFHISFYSSMCHSDDETISCLFCIVSVVYRPTRSRTLRTL